MTTYRVFISTDLGGDPDDIQSLYRLIHFSDILRIEGIISSYGPGSTNKAEGIRHWIQRVDVESMRANGHPELMAEADLLACVRQGLTKAGPPSADRATEASQLLIERAHAASEAPLWVLAWGSITDIAQALHDDPSIAPRIRLYWISSSNRKADEQAYAWVHRFMTEQAPQFWWIENGDYPFRERDTFRGVYEGGFGNGPDEVAGRGPWSNTGFVEHQLRGKGTTHRGLFNEPCGDAFPLAHWPKDSLKEGDSPSFLYLLSPTLGGPGDVDDPTQPNWGGRFHRPDPERLPNYFTDLPADAPTCRATINRWRKDHLQSWLDRWAWYPQG